MINSSQHTSTITCTAAPRVWHFNAFHWEGALIVVLTVTRTRLTVCEVGVFHNSQKYTHSPFFLGAMHLSSLPMGTFSGDYSILSNLL